MSKSKFSFMAGTIVMGFLVFVLPVHLSAKVDASEAAKLGKTLTPMGAIKAGNADGTIPAWTGGIKTPPKGYVPGQHHVDPFASDAARFTITAENFEQHSDKLTPGTQELFRRYPKTWKMPIYPTRRSASFPPDIEAAVIANATSATLTPDGNGVLNASRSVPFPIPQNGLEAIWNHLLRYRAVTNEKTIVQVAPTAGGAFTPVKISEKIKIAYAEEGATIGSIDNIFAYFLQTVEAPARLAGNILLVHETLNQLAEPRTAWTYNPGQRRVRKAPNVAFDNPGTASDSQRTSDQLDMFNGSPERYNWELKGRKEMYVPYNAYKLHSNELKYSDIVAASHLNPENLRFELHRVWVVEATLKEGTSHIYAKRVFYIDEDSWQILMVDQYDKRGQLWRVSHAYPINYYDVKAFFDTVQAHYDLQNGRYLAFGLNNEESMIRFNVKLDRSDFSPEALRLAGRR